MDLWLVRHGEAMSAQENPARPLTPEGARAVSAIAETLAGRMGSFDLVAASGKKRALETAAILADATGYPVSRIAETGALSPNATPEMFLAFLKESEEAERLLCVGTFPRLPRSPPVFSPPATPCILPSVREPSAGSGSVPFVAGEESFSFFFNGPG